MDLQPPGLFIVGTDTGVGKTRVACWISRWLASRGHRVGVCKPAATGAEFREGRSVWRDLELLKASCPLDVPEEWIGPYRWTPPLAPSIAARLDSKDPPTLEDFRKSLEVWVGNCDLLIVEGVGGLLCPLTAEETVADLALAWGRPILIVSRVGLGTLNHTLLTVEAARSRGLEVKAVLLNRPGGGKQDFSESFEPEELRARLSVPVWGPIEYQHAGNEIPDVIDQIDWSDVIRTV